MDQKPETSELRSAKSASARVTFIIGIGIMAAVDEIIFHQILAWHHFYDRSTPEMALLSDGLLHSAELIAIVAGFFMFSALRKKKLLIPGFAWAGFLSGAGFFQIFDGIIDHKLLKTHQVRYGVENLLLYDLLWNLAGLVLILSGLWIYNRSSIHLKSIE